MRALRAVGRGLRDTYDNLFTFCIASVLWWIATLPVWVLWPAFSGFALLGFLIAGPAGTLALFVVTDPRRIISRPDLPEMISLAKSRLVPGWKLMAATLPLPLILMNNIVVFSGSDQWLVNLVPLWTVLTVITLGLMVVAFGVAALFELSLRDTLTRALFVLIAAPFRTLIVLAAVVVLAIIAGVTVIPAILFGPALLSAILNRHLVQVFRLEVIDPNAPTDERVLEKRGAGAQANRGRFWQRQ